MKNGAKFIVSYFDENSSSDRMIAISNKTNEFIYKKLFDWVLGDNEIGLICSPKKPDTLRARLSGLAKSMDAAKNSGRCMFMEGKARTYNYPIEAAKASDIAIGPLIGGATVLESLLAGIKAVYIDLEGVYHYPEYKESCDSPVYSDMDELIRRVNAWRLHKEDIPESYDLLDRKDPFRDGRAAERLGGYLKSLLDSFEKGFSRSEALDSARRSYSELWGKRNIICP
jgi:hypothetical protein